jgi:hypothetical protein
MKKISTEARSFLVVWLLSIGLFGCGRSGEDTGPDVDPNSETPDPIPNDHPVPAPSSLNCPEGTSLTYETFGQGFMLNHCVMCHSSTLEESKRHGAPVGVDFDSARGIAIWNAAIAANATDKEAKMPPAGNVTPEEKKLLKTWLECGSPSSP